MIQGLEEAMKSIREHIAQNYKEFVENQYKYLLENKAIGNKFIENRHGETIAERNARWELYKRNKARLNIVMPSCKAIYKEHTPEFYYELDTDRLTRNAELYAHAATDAWKAKIDEKLHDLSDVKIDYLSGGNFQVTGTRNSKAVLIRQQTVLKQSNTGTLFHQFPALIYVDSKFYPEEEYKLLFGDIKEKAAPRMPLLHYDLESKYGHVACGRKSWTGRGIVHATREKRRVTCPKCLASKAMSMR